MAETTQIAGGRQERIATLAFDYAAQPKEAVARCNLCGSSDFVVLSRKDRYGYPAEAHGCRRCGLVFLNPVMTAQAYKRFYVEVYRPLVSAYHGRLIDAKTIQAEQREYAVERGDLLAPFLENKKGGSLLDIGGSTGVVAHAFCSRFGLKGTVIDPAPMELQEAQRLGLRTIAGLVEEYDSAGEMFDVVVMCQTIDHLLDIARTLRAIRSLLKPDGVFFVDIIDFRAGYLRHSSIEEAVKIDHPYYLTEVSTQSYLTRAGFDVLQSGHAADQLHISYVCRAGAAAPSSVPQPARVARLFEEIRSVQNTPLRK